LASSGPQCPIAARCIKVPDVLSSRLQEPFSSIPKVPLRNSFQPFLDDANG
jgi:hypothetical protein